MCSRKKKKKKSISWSANSRPKFTIEKTSPESRLKDSESTSVYQKNKPATCARQITASTPQNLHEARSNMFFFLLLSSTLLPKAQAWSFRKNSHEFGENFRLGSIPFRSIPTKKNESHNTKLARTGPRLAFLPDLRRACRSRTLPREILLLWLLLYTEV